MAEASKSVKSSLKNPQATKRPPESRRVTFMSPKPNSPKQPRLMTNVPANDNSGKQQGLLTSQEIATDRPIAGEEVFTQVVMLEMKAIALRGENLWQITDVASKVKNAALQIIEEDRVLYQIDSRLNDYANKMEVKAQKFQESAEYVEYVRDATAKLREKFQALRST